MNTFPRESVEVLPVIVTVDGVAVTTNVQFAVTASGVRPTSWSAPALTDDGQGVLVSGYAPGFYTVWARVTSSPETPVLECGSFRVS